METRKFRIVAIDDDKDILDLIHLTLDADFEVITLQDPADVLEALDYIEPDITLLDVMMPKITGYHILEQMRKNPAHHQVLTIFLSAKDSIRDVKYGYKLGASFYLTKPFQPDRVRRTIDMLLQQHGLNHPRNKLLSLRDIALRLNTRLGSGHIQGQKSDTPHSEESPSGFRLRRPLSQDKPYMQENLHSHERGDSDDDSNDTKSKKWVG